MQGIFDRGGVLLGGIFDLRSEIVGVTPEFLLLEAGDFLLLESGDRLELEA
jgi:hypothetical protein